MFVFDPILLEFSTQTFMVNWMTPESAAAIRDKIWGADNPNLHKEFHTYFRLPSEVSAVFENSSVLMFMLPGSNNNVVLCRKVAMEHFPAAFAMANIQ